MKRENHLQRENRRRFLEHLDREGAAAVIPAGSPRFRNNDAEYRFRPQSDFLYLTGFDEPDAILVLAPKRSAGRSVLFLREKERDKEIWSGRRLGTLAALDVLGVDQAFAIEDFLTQLPELLQGHERIVYRSGEDEARDRDMIKVVTELRGRTRREVLAPFEWLDPRASLHEQRLRKSAAELELMRKAARWSAEAHQAAMRAVAPGVNEAEIDALIDYTFRKNGCTGAAYTNIVAGGANATILHYVMNDQPLRDGDLLLIDAGAEWDYYASDVTRTVPVNGRFSEEQGALYRIVLMAQKRAIETVAPGRTNADVHEAALDVIVDGLLELGLLQGSREAVLEEESYHRFFMHRTGHWLGLDVHDCGEYYIDGEPRPLEAGMVITVEPGLYIAADEETVEVRWRGIGVRIEDDVHVTADGYEVLTARIPKELDEVEAVCQGATLATASSPRT